MFKRLLVVVVALFGVFTLAACKGERTYKADGVYLAFSAGENYGAPQVTVVKVTIENDKIKEFYIDCLQSTAVKDEESNVTGYAFNEKTKKELGYDYRMHDGGRTMTDEEYREYLEEEGKLEWFEQADLLADYVLKNGLGNVKLDGTKLAEDAPEAISAVTVNVNHYVEVMKELLDNWK